MAHITIKVNSYSNTAELRLDPEALSWINDHLKIAFAVQSNLERTPISIDDLKPLIDKALEDGDDLAKFIDDTRKAMIELLQFAQGTG